MRKIQFMLKHLLISISIFTFAGCDVGIGKNENSGEVFKFTHHKLTANSRYVAFEFDRMGLKTQIVIFDILNRTWSLVEDFDLSLTDPKLSSKFPDIVFFSRHKEIENPIPSKRMRVWSDAPTTELLKCKLPEIRCEIVYDMQASFIEPIETDDGGLLFGSSPAGIYADHGNHYGLAYNFNDFYHLSRNRELTRLTNFDFPYIRSINLISNQVIFGTYKIKPFNTESYKLDIRGASMRNFGSDIKPFSEITEHGDSFPSLVNDGAYYAVKGADLGETQANEAPGWQYNIGIVDRASHKVIAVIPALGFRPFNGIPN